MGGRLIRNKNWIVEKGEGQDLPDIRDWKRAL